MPDTITIILTLQISMLVEYKVRQLAASRVTLHVAALRFLATDKDVMKK